MTIDLPALKEPCVYAIWDNIRPDKCYIGKTVNYAIRAKRHLNDLKAKRHGNSHLQRLFDKDAELSISPIDICEKEMLSMREVFWVSFFNSNTNGYNMSKGGESLPDKLLVWSKERKEAWSKYCSENPIAIGTKKSPEWKEKIKESLKRRRAAGVLSKHLNIQCTVVNQLNNIMVYKNIKEAAKLSNVAYTHLTEKLKEGGGKAVVKNLTFRTNE